MLRQRGFDGVSADSWMSEVLEELAIRCPLTNNILSGLLEYHHPPRKEACCYLFDLWHMMFLRCHELRRIQRVNSILLIGQASVNVSQICRLHI